MHCKKRVNAININIYREIFFVIIIETNKIKMITKIIVFCLFSINSVYLLQIQCSYVGRKC